MLIGFISGIRMNRLIGAFFRRFLSRQDGGCAGSRPFSLRRLAQRAVAVGLSLLLVFSPLSPLMLVKPLAPIAPAQATATDDLVSCLNIANAAVDAATDIAKAVANPEYTACIAEAAAGNVLTIGMMAAVTALWATDTSAFNNPGECNAFVAGKLLGLVAQGISALLGAGDGFVGDLLKSIIGQEGIDLIKDLAKYAGIDVDKAVADAKDEAAKQAAIEAKKAFDKLVQEFSTVAAPLMHYLSCGCAAAGTVAIVKNAGEGVAKAAGGCWDLLKDPTAIFQAIFDDPGAVAKAVVGAACDAVKEVVDVCGFASDVYDTLKQACDIPGIDYACDGVGKVGHAVYCVFFDCDESKPYDPLAGANSATCEPGQFDSASEWFHGCKCPQPMGKKADVKYECGSLDYNTQTGTCTPTAKDGATCQVCDSNEGTQKTSDGDSVCVKCTLGMTSRNPDGTLTSDGSCSAQLICADDARLNVATNKCFKCGPGMHFSPDGQSCWPDCQAPLVNNPDPNSSHACGCPRTADGKYQELTGSSLDTCAVPTDCPWYAPRNAQTNACEPICTDTAQHAVPKGDVQIACEVCPDGKVSINNECKYLSGTAAVAQCAPGQIHVDGVCEDCPYGTQKGEGNTCGPVCPAGSQPKAQTAKFTAGQVTQASSATLPGFFGKQTGDISAKDLKAADNAQLRGLRNAGGSGGTPSLADQICVKCAENEQSVTLTSYGAGYSVSEQACMKCPEGQVSSPGGKCHKPFNFDVSVFSPQRPDRDADKRKDGRRQPPEKSKPRTSTADPQGKPRLDGTPALTEKPKIKCPPGQIPEGGRCRVPQARGAPEAPQLDMPSFGGGSSAPGVSAPSRRSPSGGFNTTPVAPQTSPYNPKPF